MAKITPKSKKKPQRKVPGRKYTVSKGKPKKRNPGGLTGQAGKAASAIKKAQKNRY